MKQNRNIGLRGLRTGNYVTVLIHMLMVLVLLCYLQQVTDLSEPQFTHLENVNSYFVKLL